VHASQGVTVGTTHAVLAENATRSLFYVAMTRGREANTAYLCQRTPAPDDHEVVTHGAHVAVRGSGRDAARVAHAILARHDVPGTAHQVAAHTAPHPLPDLVARLMNRRSAAVSRRRAAARPRKTPGMSDWQPIYRFSETAIQVQPVLGSVGLEGGAGNRRVLPTGPRRPWGRFGGRRLHLRGPGGGGGTLTDPSPTP
jgi:hypothetical protein